MKGVRNAVKTGKVKAFAHITGGGLIENIPRVLPENLSVELDAKKWKIPEVFAWLAVVGGINESELLRTFNCGIGGVVIVAKEEEGTILRLLQDYDAVCVGSVVPRSKGFKFKFKSAHKINESVFVDCAQVIVNNFMDIMETRMRKYVPDAVSLHATPKKKVGVLISGTGTNLQALIDATTNPTRHIGAEIVLVISNKMDVEGLKRAERANIPTKVGRHLISICRYWK